jgi:tetratricopeptide (TPR) repeat protein
MKIQLDYKIDIEIVEGDKTKESLVIALREFTKDEKKEFEEMRKQFEQIFKKGQKLINKQMSLKKKTSLYEANGNFDKALEAIEENQKLDDELEVLIEKLSEIGGGDQDAFAEKVAKTRFEKLVSGSDKTKLEAYANIKGYTQMMKLLDSAKSDLEKKQSGE